MALIVGQLQTQLIGTQGDNGRWDVSGSNPISTPVGFRYCPNFHYCFNSQNTAYDALFPMYVKFFHLYFPFSLCCICFPRIQ